MGVCPASFVAPGSGPASPAQADAPTGRLALALSAPFIVHTSAIGFHGPAAPSSSVCPGPDGRSQEGGPFGSSYKLGQIPPTPSSVHCACWLLWWVMRRCCPQGLLQKPAPEAGSPLPPPKPRSVQSVDKGVASLKGSPLQTLSRSSLPLLPSF